MRRSGIKRGLLLPQVAIGLTITVAILLSTGIGRAHGAGQCAARFSKAPIGMPSPAGQTFVPVQGLSGVVVCRYEGEQLPPRQGGTRGSLVGERVLVPDPGAATRWARALNRLPTVKPPETLHCPIDLGGRLYLLFEYRKKESVLVRAQLSGCRLVTSPHSRHVYLLSPHVQRRLEVLTS